MNKTYIELEQLGIVGMYKQDNILYIVTRGGNVWKYSSIDKDFGFIHNLNK